MTKLLSFWFVWAASLVSVVHLGHAAADPTRLSNGSLQLGFEPRGGALVELLAADTWHNHVGAPAHAPLWELEFLPGAAASSLSPTQAQSFRCERIGPDQSLRLLWDDFNLPAAPKLRVQVTVRLDKTLPLSRWQISLHNLGDLVPARVRFPRVLHLPRQQDERLAVPVWLGQQTANARQLLSSPGGNHRLEWAYPGLLSLQCLALYQPSGPGLYVACDDTAAFRKTFAVFADFQTNLSCELVHLPEHGRPAADHWELPYQVMLGTFNGDWVTAAERYRAWATNQVWARESRLARGVVPDWVLQTGLWVWNRGRSPDVLAPALELQKQLGLPVNVFWHWWHGCAYDTGFPEYLPPREGANPFKAALADAHAQGLHALVYMNQRLWGLTTKSWRAENAERFAVKGLDGKIHPEVYNTFTREPCVSMCLGTGFWREKYAGLAGQVARELGVDGIYMDQACSSLTCYDPTHGHPPGGGTYWMNGFRSLAADIRQRCPGPSGTPSTVALAGEGCGESWLPYLDIMLSLQVSKERYAGPDGWEPIPFFQAVYHPYVVTYGNYSSLTMPPYDDLWPAQFAPKEPLQLLDRKFSRQFYLEQARAFVWGQQPTLANFRPSHVVDRPDEMEYVLRLARLRHRVAQYLLHGTFLRPPEVRVPEATLDMSRLSIYAGQQGGLKTFEQPSPVVIAGAWRAPNGAVAVALASIADQDMPVSIKLDSQYYRLPDKARILITTDIDRSEHAKAWRINLPIALTLRPRQACVLEFE